MKSELRRSEKSLVLVPETATGSKLEAVVPPVNELVNGQPAVSRKHTGDNGYDSKLPLGLQLAEQKAEELRAMLERHRGDRH
ncbi:MAG TPA: hypothetical protein V6C65_24905 [Allocoleopsis sp.]